MEPILEAAGYVPTIFCPEAISLCNCAWKVTVFLNLGWFWGKTKHNEMKLQA